MFSNQTWAIYLEERDFRLLFDRNFDFSTQLLSKVL